MTMRVTDQSFETLLVEQLDRVVRLTLNRADRRNAISQVMQRELVAAVEQCAQDPSVNVVVIRGAGSSFCGGYDISGSAGGAGDTTHAEPMSLPRRAMATVAMARGWSRIWNSPIPIIAQIHGHCLAGGTDLALHCDLVIAAEDATIGFPALRMGGTPPTNMWLYNIGPQWAKRLLFTGDTFTGRFAEKIGFALESVPADELGAHVMALASRVAAMGRDIVAINKFVLNKGLDLMGRAALQEFAAPMDSIANQAPEMAAFMSRAKEIGLAAAFKERDAPFAEGVPIDTKRIN
ncbi:MAG: crotonase/enoyl-CoA hydratase family protein [Rhodospirillaceae bacterium]|nr:MAG: crotonase/enoyl-CoA hydratase family protein [Rhodospirillaceae bacterium]